MADYSKMKPGEVRELIRKGEITIPQRECAALRPGEFGHSS